MTETYCPPPVDALSRANCICTSVSVDETEPSAAAGSLPPDGIDIDPRPPDTANSAELPRTVQTPPVSADPHPFVVVRVNESCASVAAPPPTATDVVFLPVAPPLSVTVRVTG